MKDLIENTWWFGLLILVLYIIIDVADARWFIPRMAGSCKGALTEHQEELCYHWIIIKNTKDGLDGREQGRTRQKVYVGDGK